MSNNEPEPEPEPEISNEYLLYGGDYIPTTSVSVLDLNGLSTSLSEISIINGYIGGKNVFTTGVSLIEKFLDTDGNVVEGVFLIGQYCTTEVNTPEPEPEPELNDSG